MKPELKDYGVFRLVEAWFLTYSFTFVVMAVFFNFLWNADLISLFIVISFLCYAMFENPIPSISFYKFIMAFVLIVVSVKFFY
jgi:hypothetical protein